MAWPKDGLTLSAQDNAKLLQQLKSDLKRTIKWNKYESESKTFAQNRYLNHVINQSYRHFALSFENEDERKSLNLLSSKSKNKRLQCYD